MKKYRLEGMYAPGQWVLAEIEGASVHCTNHAGEVWQGTLEQWHIRKELMFNTGWLELKAEKKEKQNMSNAKEEKYRGIDGLTRYLAASPAAKAEEWSVRIDGVEISPGGWGLAALLDEAVFEHKVPPTLEQLVSVPEGVTVTLESVFPLLDKPVMRVDRTGNAVSMSLSVSPGNPELSKVYAVAAQIAAMPAGTQTHTSAIVGPHNVK